MRTNLFNAIAELLSLIGPNSKQVWLTASFLTVVSIIPFLGIIFFDWRGWMILFNYYIELWILGFSVLVKFLMVKYQRPRLLDPKNKLQKAGKNIAMGAGFLLLFGIITFFEVPDIEDKGKVLNFHAQIFDVYLSKPFQEWTVFFMSPFFALIAIVVHHLFSYTLNFNPHRKAVGAEAFYKQTSRAGSRMLNTFFLMFFAMAALLFLTGASSAVEYLIGNESFIGDLFGNNLGFLWPLAFILIKTYVDVKAHIKSNSNWLGDGELFDDN